MRAAISSYFVLTAIPLALLVLYTLVAVKEASAWPVAVALAVVSVVIVLWLASFRLVLTPETFSYRTLLRARTMDLSAIERAEIHIGVATYRDRFRPTVRLELQPHSAIDKPLIVNLKVFCKTGLDELFQYLPITEPE